MIKMSKTVVFFGNEKLATGSFAVQPVIRRAVEAAGFSIEQHVTGPLSDLKPHQSKLAVLAAYGRIIPQAVLDQFPLGIINVHPSLLPQYRGPTPIEQAILDGVTKTGVSIMRLAAKMDEGPIYRQKTVHLRGNETKPQLVGQLQQLGSELLVDVLPGIANGSLQPRQQPHPSHASYTHLLRKADGVMDWTKSAEQLEREIRAYAGWPGSRTTLAGKEVIITKAHVVPTNHPPSKPGDVEAIQGLLMVECGKGTLCIERLKPAGKNEMSAAEFSRGYL